MAQAKKTEETKAVAAPMAAMTPAEIEAAKSTGTQEVVASDVLIPRLLLMQGISPLVTQRKAQIGDLIRSTTGEKLGDPEHPIEIVPLKMVNTWINFETAKSAKTQKPAFRGMEERGAHNEQLPWEYVGPQGQEMFRRKAITLYALVPGDVAAYNAEIERSIAAGEAPDLNRTIMPVVITIQSTSFKHAGKKCASFFNSVRVNQARVPTLAPFQYILTLRGREEKKGDNAWYVMDFDPAKPLKDAAVRAEAANWVKILGTSKVRVDETGEEDDGGGAAAGTVAEMEV